MIMDFKAIEGFTFIWKIENFSYCSQKKKELLKSPFFKLDGNNSQWSLGLYPRGDTDDDDGDIGFFLFPSRISLPREVSFTLSAFHVNEADRKELSVTKYRFINDNGYGFSRFMSQNEVYIKKGLGFLKNDALTLCCRIWEVNGALPNSVYCFASSRYGMDYRSFVWKIQNFLDIEKKKSMKVQSISEEDIHLTVCFSKDKRRWSLSKTMANIEIVTKSSDKRLTCKISVLDINGKEAISISDEYSFTENSSIWKFPSFIDIEEINRRKERLLPKGVLSLSFEITVLQGIQHTGVKRIEGSIKPLQTLEEVKRYMETGNLSSELQTTDSHEYLLFQKELLGLYNDQMFCDVSIQTESKNIPVHKAVLCARSPVFKAMFSKNMEESRTGVVKISDLDEDVVQQMLVFLYSNDVGELNWEKASKLYFAADKYDLQLLKEKCSAFIKSNMCPSNVCQVLVLADLHHDQGMVSSAKDYILDHAGEIVSSVEWKCFMKDNVDLAANIMHLLCMEKLKL